MDQINQRWGTPGETSIKLSFYWSVDPPALHRQANELLAELLLLHTIKGMLGLFVMADLGAPLLESKKRCLWRRSDYRAVGGWPV